MEGGKMDLELEQGLRDFVGLVQRKVIEPETRRRMSTQVDTEEEKLEKALATCPPQWSPNIKCVLFTEDQIQKKVKEMALRISKDYQGKDILAVGILTGAVCFMTDLLKFMTVPYKVDFMTLSSYGNKTTSSGAIVLKKDLSMDPTGKHILIIEDLIDTGGTLKWLKNYLNTKNCASVRLCTLLQKQARRRPDSVEIDYFGFDCPDEFVVGYGMDFAEHYRCLPFIGVLKPEAYGGN